MFVRTIFSALTLTALAMLSGCSWKSSSGSTYSSNDTQREQTVRMATVEHVREVTIDRRPTGVGAVAGAGLGGLAGSHMGKGSGSVAGAVVGAIVGGVAGQAVEGEVAKIKGLEITVRLDNGDIRAIVQEADEVFKTGERVRLLSSNGKTRVAH